MFCLQVSSCPAPSNEYYYGISPPDKQRELVRTNYSYKIDEHMNTTTNHSGEVIYSCNLCSYTSGHKPNLKRHLLTHTGERPYACSLCPFRGNQKSHIENHMKRHTGEKPFACSKCDFRTARKATLQYHVSMKHQQ